MIVVQAVIFFESIPNRLVFVFEIIASINLQSMTNVHTKQFKSTFDFETKIDDSIRVQVRMRWRKCVLCFCFAWACRFYSYFRMQIFKSLVLYWNKLFSELNNYSCSWRGFFFLFFYLQALKSFKYQHVLFKF